MPGGRARGRRDQHLPSLNQAGERRKMPTFLLEVPLVATAQHARHLRARLEAARCFSNAVPGEDRSHLRRMQADRLPAPSLVPTNQSVRRRLPGCTSSTAFPKMPCTPPRIRRAAAGLPPTSPPPWPDPWRRERIGRSIASARARPARCTSSAGNVAWRAWRANATRRGCNQGRRVIRAFLRGEPIRSRRNWRGTIRWWPMA